VKKEDEINYSNNNNNNSNFYDDNKIKQISDLIGEMDNSNCSVHILFFEANDEYGYVIYKKIDME
jgi:hypothetical protein